MEILKIFRRSKRKKISFREGLDLLLKKFDLVGKVESHIFWSGPTRRHTFTLFRIVEEGEDRNVPLPVEFIMEIKSWIHRCYGERTKSILGVYPDVKIGPAKTEVEFEKMIKDWKDYFLTLNDD
ncbi:MAG: hypothetical protein Q8Q90_00190 [bacterium]|nr:hypothetical protein [bacterium]